MVRVVDKSICYFSCFFLANRIKCCLNQAIGLMGDKNIGA